MEKSDGTKEGQNKKRKNREHTNSRAGCVQCKSRKVKVMPFELQLVYILHLTWSSATRKSPNVGLVLDVQRHAHIQLGTAA